MKYMILSLLVFAGCRAEADTPGTVVSPDMAFTVPFDPYDPNPVTKNGSTLILPPEGSVPVDGVYFGYAPGVAEGQRAGRELVNPIEANPANLKRGKHIFDTYCVVCHGAEGKGDGPITTRIPDFAGRSLVHGRPVEQPDGNLYHIITTGQGPMAAYAKQIRPDDRWRAIHYIRQLQGAK